ncbi:hypothetical protein Glove_158g110 [Diversispora epigaea]|uniref:PPPDE domain-containing protein n=1 Tax=Diversispora epigaea TaxID=1348612 RepID=A0A397IRH7_9GLOM|nr:hypothetical protein Glove_158g110 [Diversispora epigaea]
MNSRKENQNDNETLISKEQKFPVFLNVYDMLPRGKITDLGYMIGVGVFHSGVEVLNKEYNFGGHEYDSTGVFYMNPKLGPPNVRFKESFLIGYTSMDKEEIKNVIDELSMEWRGNSYNLLSRNCNHFSSELCSRLVGKPAPNWINRAARLGTFFPCILESSWIMNSMVVVPEPQSTYYSKETVKTK